MVDLSPRDVPLHDDDWVPIQPELECDDKDRRRRTVDTHRSRLPVAVGGPP